jgi:hypothetical protein
LLFAQAAPLAQTQPVEVVFPAGARQLHGFLWKPDGAGPFAAVLWNHGSEKLPRSQPVLAKSTPNMGAYFLSRTGAGKGARVVNTFRIC